MLPWPSVRLSLGRPRGRPLIVLQDGNGNRSSPDVHCSVVTRLACARLECEQQGCSQTKMRVHERAGVSGTQLLSCADLRAQQLWNVRVFYLFKRCLMCR